MEEKKRIRQDEEDLNGLQQDGEELDTEELDREDTEDQEQRDDAGTTEAERSDDVQTTDTAQPAPKRRGRPRRVEDDGRGFVVPEGDGPESFPGGRYDPEVPEFKTKEESKAFWRSGKHMQQPSSVIKNTTATGNEVSQILHSVLHWRKMPIVRTDEECAQRLNEFFAYVEENGEVPTVEKLALAMGTVRLTLQEWERGSAGELRAQMIRTAKESIHAMEVDMVYKNKLNYVVYFFRAKNYYGMKDQQEISVTSNPYESGSAESVAKKYIQGMVGDGVEIVDGEGDVK